METYLDENAAFHAAVLSLAGNRQLQELSARLRLPLIMAQVGDALNLAARLMAAAGPGWAPR